MNANGAAPPPVAVQQTTVIQVGSQKSVAGAVLLAFFFGPLGMLYATVPGALIMFLISFLVAIATLGLGLLVTLPICAIWAGIAASSHNKRLGVSGQHAAMVGQPLAPAGWHPDPAGGGRLRYYDGTRWTDHYAEHGSPPAAAAEEESLPQLEEAAPGRGEEEPDPDDSEAQAAQAEAPTVVAEAEPQPVFCGACGQGISATARFCPACGEAQAVA